MATAKEDDSAISHKGETLISYTAEFKMKAILHAEKFSINSSARHFGVDRRTVSRWVQNRIPIHAQTTAKKGKERKRLADGGRKPLSEELEKKNLKWVLERRAKGLCVSRILIMKKASVFFQSMENSPDTEFSASKGWCSNFMRRNGLSLRSRVTVCLTAQASGKKMKPFIVFQGAKRKTKQRIPWEMYCCIISKWLDEF